MSKNRLNCLGSFRVTAVLCIVFVAGCAREKDRLDEEVRQLCAKDGGIKLYEQMKLPSAMFDKYGDVRFPDRTPDRPYGNSYQYSITTKRLKEGNPAINRYEELVIRNSDRKLLGQKISYSRIGGDLPGPWIDSHFSCPESVVNVQLTRRVFIDEVSKGETK